VLVKIEARILIFPGTDFRFPSTSVPPGTFLGSGEQINARRPNNNTEDQLRRMLLLTSSQWRDRGAWRPGAETMKCTPTKVKNPGAHFTASGGGGAHGAWQ